MEDQEAGSITLSCAWGPGHVHYPGSIVSDGLGLGNVVVIETTEVPDLVCMVEVWLVGLAGEPL